MATVQLTRFRVSPALDDALLAAHAAMLRDLRAERAGFLTALLVRLTEDEWLDIVSWRSPEDLAAARSNGDDLPGVRAFSELIGEIIGSEQGTTVDGTGWSAGPSQQPG